METFCCKTLGFNQDKMAAMSFGPERKKQESENSR